MTPKLQQCDLSPSHSVHFLLLKYFRRFYTLKKEAMPKFTF